MEAKSTFPRYVEMHMMACDQPPRNPLETPRGRGPPPSNAHPKRQLEHKKGQAQAGHIEEGLKRGRAGT